MWLSSRNYKISSSKEVDWSVSSVWDQQERATAHTARASMNDISGTFAGRAKTWHGDTL